MAKTNPYYESVRSALETELSRGREPENIFWEVVDGVAAIIDAGTDTKIASGIGGGTSVVYSMIKHGEARNVGPTPNPFFVWNGHDGSNRYTQRYLRNTSLKAIGSGVISVGSGVASQATQVDIAGSFMHGSASKSTFRHLVQLQAIADSYQQSETIAAWLDLVMRMKIMKLGIRGSQLVGAVVPIGAVGVVTSVGAAAARIGVKLTMTKVCLAAAAEIHWRAYLEQKISGFIMEGSGGKIGPASKVVHELFTHRGITAGLFSNYKANKLIMEPSGWLAVSHKLLQM
ncbi:MAG: hypothetical protein AB8G17_18385 [Gammaproteobacteria bacterium]